MAPAAWDRLADARQPRFAGERPALAVVTLGHVHGEDLEPLAHVCSALEQLVLDVAPRDPLAAHRAEFNRAVDAASHDWILIVRERERVDEALAGEIATAVASGKARGFRIRSVPFYCGRPLQMGDGGGDVRLFHRRYYLRYATKGEWQQLAIQGTVVRLDAPLRAISFATAEEHRAQLDAHGARRPFVVRLLQFIRFWAGIRTLDGTTLRYLWIEAGWKSST